MYINHSRECFTGYPNTSNFVKNTLLHVIISTLFLLFEHPDEALFFVFDIIHKKVVNPNGIQTLRRLLHRSKEELSLEFLITEQSLD